MKAAAPVIAETVGSNLRAAVLNRPQALNALNGPMVQLLSQLLQK